MASTESIFRLRERFEQELSHSPTAYHSIDIERVRTEEWQVKRFLLEHQHDERKAFEAMCKTLKWKQSFGLHLRTDQYFPREFWVLNQLEMTGQDREGRLIVWGSSKNQRKFKELSKLQQLFVAHHLEKADRLAGEKGAIMVGDTKGSSIFNADRDLQDFQLELMNHYPLLARAMYVVDLPWILNSFMKLCLGLMNAKHRSLVHFVNAEQLTEVIEPEHIPVNLNGKRQVEVYPDNLIPFDQRYHELGVEEKFVNHYYKTFNLQRTK